MADPQLRILARKVAAIEKQQLAAKQPRLAYSTIDDGAITAIDADGNLTMAVGAQHDGTNSAASLTGPKPPTPLAPLVTDDLPGGLTVYWDGTFEDPSRVAPMDFVRVTAHAVPSSVGLAGFDPLIAHPAKASLSSAAGGEMFIVSDPGVEMLVVLVAWSESGKLSDPSLPSLGSARILGIDVNSPEWLQTQADITAAQTAATDAQAASAAAQATADQAATTANNAGDTAAAAQTTANQAQTDAAEAVGIANGKGVVRIQSTVPAAADQNDVTLWIDTTAGANTPKRWNATSLAWEAVTDKVAVDAANTAAAAQADASAALTTAQQAAADADAAGAQATSAQQTADSKNTVYNATYPPSNEPNVLDDIWWFRDATTGNIKGLYRGLGGTAWSSATMDNQVIANLDAGKVTFGTMSGERIEVGTLVISQMQNLQGTLDSKATPADVDAAEAAAIQAAIANSFLNTNPTFADWTGATPVGYGAWNTGPTKETGIVRPGPNAMRFNVAAATDAGATANAPVTPVPFTDYLVVEAEVYLASGTFGGAGILVDWVGATAPNRATLRFDDVTSPETGKWYRFTKTLKRPTAGGTQTSWSTWLMANYSGLGTKSAKDIIFGRVGFRPATAEEITAYNAPANIAAAESSAVATADANANSNYGTTKNLVAGWVVTGKTTINGGQIETDSILAGSIKAGQINSGHVVTAGLDAGVIKFGSMHGDRISLNTLNSNHIVTAGLDAGVIKFGTMSGDRITANTITATQINFSNMNGEEITGALVRTASSSTRVEMRNAPNPFVSNQTWGMLQFYNSSASWYPGQIWGQYDGASVGSLSFTSPYLSSRSSADAARITLNTWSDGSNSMSLNSLGIDITAGTMNLSAGSINLYSSAGSVDFNTFNTNAVLFRQGAGARQGFSMTFGAVGIAELRARSDPGYAQPKMKLDGNGVEILGGGGGIYGLGTVTWGSYTGSGGATNLQVGNSGVMSRATSSRRYKTDIRTIEFTPEQAEKILDLRPVTYLDIIQDDGIVYPGFIAEEAHELGLHPWVVYEDIEQPDGTFARVPDGFHYDKFTAAHQVILRELRDRIKVQVVQDKKRAKENADLKAEVAELRSMVEALASRLPSA